MCFQVPRRCRLKQLPARVQTILLFVARCASAIYRRPTIFLAVVFASIFSAVRLSLLVFTWGTWAPAFPRAWTNWVAFLISAPIFSAVRLFSLLRPASSSPSRPTSWTSSTARGHDGYALLSVESGEDLHQAVTSDILSPPHTHRHPTEARATFTFHNAQCAFHIAILIIALWNIVDYEKPGDVRFRSALHTALADPNPNPAGYGRGEKIFIAAAFHQNEAVLPYWTETIMDTITYLGPDNVFVSVVENYSTDRSPELLREFAADLDGRGVRNRVLVQNETIERPEDMNWNPRIEFLAGIRNQVLEPLVAEGGYDRVLFSNDIYIEAESVIELLETREGDYDFACGMDFGHFGAYDMWVLRDRLGHLTAGIWPYFLDAASRAAVEADEAVPVFTCWNGMVAFRADPVLPVHLRSSNSTLSTAPLARLPPATHPLAGQLGPSPAWTPGLRFRASGPNEGCFSSESFLLPYDFRRVMGLEGVFANARVVSGYTWRHYVWHKWVLRQRLVRWFVERVWDGAWMHRARLVVGDEKSVWTWDGGECHPWW